MADLALADACTTANPRVPKKEDTPIAEPSIYADNIIPVVDDAIDADTDKKNKINKSNSESNVPTSAVTIPI